MNILSIETSCDETSVAVLQDGRNLLSNVISSQVPIHKLYGGVVPEIASRKHIENIDRIIDEAMAEAELSFDEIDLITVTEGPGLVGALLVGLSYAKALAYYLGVPVVGVNHIEGHIAANYICHKELEPPFIALIISGGHTYLVDVKDYCDFELVGSTRDDASGEAFDKVARALGLPYPGGPEIDRLAKSGNESAVNFPRVYLEEDSYDFSFSGLKTAVINYIHNKEQSGEEINKADLAASFQAAVVEVLKNKTFRLVSERGRDKIVLCGGVASNSKIRGEFKVEANKAGIEIYYPEPVLCTDNAAMIGSQGYFRFINDGASAFDMEASPNLEFCE